MSAPPGAGLRLGLIGAGAIAEFHAPALKEAGFELSAVCTRPGSVRAREFAQRHGVPRVLGDAPAMLAAREEWDALVVTVPADCCLEVLLEVVPSGAPVLVEKPVSFAASDIAPLLGRGLRVQVGYNRRFYRPVAMARENVRNGPPVLATLTLPEAEGANPQATLTNFFTNSVHGLDLARFVFGDLEVVGVERLNDEHGDVRGVAALLQSSRGDAVQFLGNWGTPANYALAIDRPGQRTELRPLETAAVFTRMEMTEPTAERPVRSYLPQVTSRVELDSVDLRLKPGFFAQAEAFARLCRGEDLAPAASLEDARAVLALAEALAGANPRGSAS
jgi:predicted dehydrogenase